MVQYLIRMGNLKINDLKKIYNIKIISLEYEQFGFMLFIWEFELFYKC